jgi:phosphinothricin acetyltransferase
LHEAFGFTQVGVYRGIGYKKGAWHDVVWYEAAVQPERAHPAMPRPLPEVVGTAAWQQILAEGATRYGR